VEDPTDPGVPPDLDAPATPPAGPAQATPSPSPDDLTPRVGTLLAGAGPDDTAKIDVAPGVPLPPPPKPKPVIIAERAGDDGWRTNSLELRRASDGHYLTLGGPAKRQVIHLTANHLEQLLGIAQADHPGGGLWRRLQDIPLERPLPNRQLEEELRVLLNTFANELRQRPPRR
jgi:hypothetical protein